ncbi:MAG: allantoinase AllB [Actinomycetota bacterium]|nr:allantoinase AllB [Actinomycetota bacterium]
MSFDRAFRARRAIVDGAEVSCVIGVRDERIAAIDPIDAEVRTDELIELAADEVLLPGLVDTHVHVNEPGRTEWEGFDTATRAAAAGGVTTIIDMPLNSIPPTTTLAGLAAKQECAESRVHVDVGFWGGAVPGNIDDLAQLYDAGVFGFKCFLIDSGVSEFPPLDGSDFVAAMAETARLGALMIVHAEDAEVIEHAPAAQGAGYGNFLHSRPRAAEATAIGRVVETARATGARAHILHLSSADALAALRAARSSGVDLSVETCPHYLTLDADAIPDGATEFKCCPPIRELANQDRLWTGLDTGDIDMIVSDHSPCTVELKRLDTGDFGEAWGGIASVQLGLPVVWTAARARGRSLGDVVLWMAQRPADRVGLARKGRIEIGADADLCVLAPDAEFVVDTQRLRHKNPICAYAGSRLSGVVRQTWLRGARVDPDAEPHGRLLRRGQR